MNIDILKDKEIDIIEDEISNIDPQLLQILLEDKTTKKNILWATKDYEVYGREYAEKSQIYARLITHKKSNVIQPRAAKSKEIREMRIKKKAEVFTPSWICNMQNNQIDEEWFGVPDVFNIEKGEKWVTTKKRIKFNKKDKTWQSYIIERRLEITCGEAPYLVSRYDTTTGDLIPTKDRIGLFDRKMRVVNENCDNDEDWISWSKKALQSIYGYEFQGDSVLVARENILYDYIDYYEERFNSSPSITLLKEISNIISWNIWQMDGLKCVVPYSCHDVEQNNKQLSLFDDNDEKERKKCPGCDKNDIFEHNGIYCRIFDWIDQKKSITFVSLMNGGMKNGKI